MDDALGEQLIDAVHVVAGTHPGYRALHARGIGVTGAFTASGDAAAVTTASYLQAGVETPVEARFSNGSGDPHQSDGGRDGRGFAVKFRLADGSSTDLVGLSLPVFFVRTPADFLAFLQARTPDPATGQPDLDRILAFLGEHPEAQTAVGLSMAALAPVSYTTVTYHGVHAFWATDATGAHHKVRYRWDPDQEPATVTDDDAAARPADYLQAELRDRLAASPAGFTLRLVLGADGDDETDPTTAWPEDRAELDAGHLVLDVVPGDQAGIDALIFDPTRLAPGFAVTDDQILLARAAAYGVSYAQRRA